EDRPALAVVVAVRGLPAVEIRDAELELECECTRVGRVLHAVEPFAEAIHARAGGERKACDRDGHGRYELRSDRHRVAAFAISTKSGGSESESGGTSTSARRCASQRLVVAWTASVTTIARATVVTTSSECSTP